MEVEGGGDGAAPSTSGDANCCVGGDRELLMEMRRLERVYRRRREAFELREGGKATDRMFILSDDRPWVLFARDSRTQRRKWAFETSSPMQWSDLHEAARVGDLDAVKRLLRPPRTSVPSYSRCSLRRDACGRIALHQAVVCERWETVRWLLKRTDIALQLRAVDFSGRTPVHYALERMEQLALRHPSRKAGQPVHSVTTAMRESCDRYRRLWRYSDRMISRMVSTDTVTDTMLEVETVKALDFRIRGHLWDACRYGDVKRFQFVAQTYFGHGSGHLLKEESVLGELKWSLLHEACSQGHASIVDCLLTDDKFRHFQHSDLLFLQDSSGCTALHCAAKRFDVDVCELILQDNSMSSNSFDDDLSIIDDMMPLCRDKCGRTALHWSLLATGSTDIIEVERQGFAKWLALKCPSALNIHDNDGATPLHLAVCRGDVDLVRHFLELGANPDGVQFIDNTESCDYSSRSKAPWAPCGLMFQHRLHETTPRKSKHESEESLPKANTVDRDTTAKVDAIAETEPISLDSRTKLLRLFESPISTNNEYENEKEALYYWIRRMTAHRCARLDSNIVMEQESKFSWNDNDYVGSKICSIEEHDERIGCSKYGAVCAVCQPLERGQSPSARRKVLQLTPLMLAIRNCSLSSYGSAEHRRAIVSLLLNTGADPDGVHDTKSSASPLLEAVRTAQPELIEVLLLHGASKLDFELLEQHCCDHWTAKTFESVTRPLLDLPWATQSEVLLTLLFERKCFELLRQVISSAVTPSGWHIILEHQRKRQTASTIAVDEDHVLFLTRLLERDSAECASQGNENVEPRTRIELLELLRLCIEVSFHRRQSPKSPVNRRLDEILVSSMKLLRSQGIRSSNISVERLISCGLFEAATDTMESDLNYSDTWLSVDKVFQAFEVGIRRLTMTSPQTHYFKDEYLCLWLTKLTTKADLKEAKVAITARSIVCACAYNLPFTLIQQCIALVMADFQEQNGECDGFDLVSRLTEELKSIRVGSKQLEQWLVTHRRLDVIHTIFETLSMSPDSVWSFWRKLMAAAATELTSEASLMRDDGCISDLNGFINELFALSHTLTISSHEISAPLELESLQWLLLRYLIPIDHEPLALQLLRRIGELEAEEDQEFHAHKDGDAGESYDDKIRVLGKSGLLQWLVRARFVYACARWNAVRVLDAALALFSSSEERHACFFDEVNDVDGADPRTIARLLGHREISRLLPIKRDNPWMAQRIFGLLRAVLLDNELKTALESSDSPRSMTDFDGPSIVDDWIIACKLNHARQLAILADLSLSSTQLNQSFGELLLTCISCGAFDAIQWFLSKRDVSALLSEETAACIDLAARRSIGDVYANILLLLLDQGFPPGRLAGDGADITILHHAARIRNSLLASQLITRILSIQGCDINVLDCYGNTPVMYALASGRLENACFLIQHATCRLEAEYEGQAGFYYALNLVPSRPSRLIVKALLMKLRSHAFLHCDAESGACACKGFEPPTALDEHAPEAPIVSLCSFCGHAKVMHCILPLPSWFRDQYDSYADMRGRQPEASNVEDNDNGYIQNNGSSQDHLTQLRSDDELENARGRLDAAALAHLAVIRYEPIVHHFDIIELLAQHSAGSSDSTASATECDADVENPESYWPMVELGVLGPSTPGRNHRTAAHQREVEGTGDLLQPQTFPHRSPSFVRTDVALLHPPSCSCQCIEFVVTRQMLLYHVVCRWLRQTSFDTFTHAPTVHSAFMTWRRTTTSCARPASQNPREQLLKRAVVANWRLGRRVLSAFRSWRQQLSPAVAHHLLEDAVLNIAASMRRERVEALRARHAHVQQVARRLLETK